MISICVDSGSWADFSKWLQGLNCAFLSPLTFWVFLGLVLVLGLGCDPHTGG